MYEQTLLGGQSIGTNTFRLDDEKTVYKIRCWLLGYKTEDDRDYHLIIGDERRRVTMVAEICDPTCPDLIKSTAYNNFVEVRNKFELFFNGRSSHRTLHLHIHIEGIGFFDKKHSNPPTGNAHNNREIHPITKLTFLRR